MIYTVGHKQNYLDAIEKYGSITKLPDGFVFRTLEDAKLFIEMNGETSKDWIVWGLDADWIKDTKTPGHSFMKRLVNECPIIPLESELDG